MYEYACHEGNMALEHILQGERAYEKAAANAKAKGLAKRERLRAGQRPGPRTLNAATTAGLASIRPAETLAHVVIRLKRFARTVCYGQSFM